MRAPRPFAGLLALTLVAGCPDPRSPPDPGVPAPPAVRSAVLLASADVRGALAPVPDVRTATVGHAPGAPRPAAPPEVGGLGRRAAALAAAGGLYVDAGDLFFSAYRVLPHRRAAALAAAQAHAVALGRMGLAAMAVGEGDLALGQDTLRSLAGAAGARLLSANLVHAGTSTRAFDPFAVVTQGSLRVGVVGASPVFGPERPEADAYRFSRLEARPVGPAVAEAAAAARAAGAEVVVALLHLPDAEAAAVLGALPPGAVDAAVTAHRLGPGGFAEGRGGPSARGRGLVRLAVAVSGAQVAVQGAAVRLDGAAAPGWAAATLASAHAPVGPEACAGACHPEALTAWRATGHARALAALAAKKQGGNPDCLVCHATAFDPARGLAGVQAGVSCEACHGASAAHMADGVAPPEHGREVPLSVCGGCHGVQADQAPFHIQARLEALAGAGH